MALTLTFAALCGAAIGSFAGVVAARGLRGAMAGRSHCDGCGRPLKWYELIPLVSYPALRGRCRTCTARVGLGVYAWEMGGAIIALVAAVVIILMLGRSPP
jgi:leader peptidase (prepilin peptidase) / N-methyltransferase